MEYVPLNPMTAALDSDKTVLVQSGSSLARDNFKRKKRLWLVYLPIFVSAQNFNNAHKSIQKSPRNHQSWCTLHICPGNIINILGMRATGFPLNQVSHSIRYQRADIELQIVHTEILSEATLNSLSEMPQILSKVGTLTKGSRDGAVVRAVVRALASL